jgi:predicted enzyme related to lactoylglutathione lyase
MTTRSHVAGGLVHFDIAGPDEDALRAFYGATFGWAVDVQGPGYALVRTPEGSADGAIVDADEAAITIGIAVADLEATIAAAVAAGGAVHMPPTDNGWVVKAQVTDPAGNRVTLVQS